MKVSGKVSWFLTLFFGGAFLAVSVAVFWLSYLKLRSL